MAKTPVNANEVREWAREQGITVGTRGRLSEELIAKFNRSKRGRKVYADPGRVEAAEDVAA